MAAGTIILGAGQGGFQVAASLREHGFAGPIALIGNEGMLPYQRPPLSKTYLLGELDAERLLLRPQAFYATRNIELILADRATAIDRAGCSVTLASGRTLAYEHLVLALGARNRILPVPGAGLDGVFHLRTRAEADAIHARLLAARHIVVVGAGFIGLELAAVASKLGKQVTVVEALGRAMSRAVTPPISDFYAQAHAAWGTELLLNARLQAIEGENGRVAAVSLADGRKLAAELVLVGIGITPNVELAVAAGLATANGIVVDARLATADPRISAIGDCAAFPDPASGQFIRLESVQNAVDQGRCVGKRIAGQGEDYTAVPWFWSDQRDLKLQMVGLTAGCEETVLRGDPATRAFSVFGFRGGRLVGIESVNRAADHMFGRRLLAAGESITPEEAGNLGFDLKARLSRIAAPARAP
jgi:3-phenylpropionate/trans-cinnamate dioxygenase ferredoxin reductase component